MVDMFDKEGANSGFDKQTVYGQKVPAGRRVYFIDVKETQGGDPYLSLAERTVNSDGSVEKRRIFVFREDLVKFTRAVEKAADKIKELTPDFVERHTAEE